MEYLKNEDALHKQNLENLKPPKVFKNLNCAHEISTKFCKDSKRSDAMMSAFCVEFLTLHVFNCLGLSQSVAAFAMNFSSHWTFQAKEVETSTMAVITTG